MDGVCVIGEQGNGIGGRGLGKWRGGKGARGAGWVVEAMG